MLSRLTKLIVAVLLYGIRVGLHFLGKKTASVTVVTYHAVKEWQVASFRRHMEELIKIGRPVSARIKMPMKTNDHYIAVTFDDGFQSVIEHALPVMADMGIPATIFIPTGYLGTKAGWILDREHSNANETVMTRTQIADFAGELFLFGSHSVTHSRLSSVTRVQAREELVKSKQALEEIIKSEVDLLSLPYGACDPEVLRLAKLAGYQRVFLNVPVQQSELYDGFVSGRIDMSFERLAH